MTGNHLYKKIPESQDRETHIPIITGNLSIWFFFNILDSGTLCPSGDNKLYDQFLLKLLRARGEIEWK